MTLDPQSAAKAFTDMLILLGKMQGIVGIPSVMSRIPTLKDLTTLILIMRPKPPAFSQQGSPYFLT
jgi:hypothetical protein